MSNLSVNTITDASGGSTASINGLTPQASNMQPFNRIINGAMTVDQRNAGASVTPTNGQYSVDRFWTQNSVVSKFSLQQNAGAIEPPTGFKNYVGITSLSSYTLLAGDYFSFNQTIEAYNIQDLAFGTAEAKSITLSFWVRSSLTGVFGGALSIPSGARTYQFNYSITAPNTWEFKTVVLVGDVTGTWPSGNSGGMRICWGLGVGSTYGSGTAGAWSASNMLTATGATSVVGTNGATFYITGVQLEAGSTASSFAHENVGDTLRKCQRYFTKSYDIATALGAATSVNAVITGGSNAGTTSGFVSGGGIRYPIELRANPTIAIYDPAGTVNKVQRWTLSVNNVNGEISVVDSIASKGFLIYSASGATASGLQFQYTASAEL